MQPWKDDYALFYNLQQNIPFVYPYQQLVALYKPFYQFFGIAPFGYFVLGLVCLIISAILFYILSYRLLSQKTLAFIAGIFYVTSPAGVESILFLMTFATVYFSLILFLAALLLIFLYSQKKAITYYVIALALLTISFILIPYRSVAFILPTIMFDFVVIKKGKKWIKNFAVRQALLMILGFVSFYIYPKYVLPQDLRYPIENTTSLLSNIFDYNFFANPFLTSINTIFGSFAYPFHLNFSFNGSLTHYILLIATILFILYIVGKFRRDKHVFLFVFSVVYVYVNALSYYGLLQREITSASHRYMLCALPGVALFMTLIYMYLIKIFPKHKMIPLMFLLISIGINIYATQTYLSDFNTRASYSIQFYSQLKQLVPHLEKNAPLYIEPENDPQIKYRLTDSYRGGHYDERAAFASHYHMKMEDVSIVYNTMEDLGGYIKKKPELLDSIIGLRYDSFGLHDITEAVRKKIKQTINYQQ